MSHEVHHHTRCREDLDGGSNQFRKVDIVQCRLRRRRGRIWKQRSDRSPVVLLVDVDRNVRFYLPCI